MTPSPDWLESESKKYGTLEAMPVIRSMVSMSRTKYADKLAEAFKAGARAAIERMAEEKIEFLVGLLMTPLSAFGNLSALDNLKREGGEEYVRATLRRMYSCALLEDGK